MKQKLILIIILSMGLFSSLWGQNNLKQIDISEDDYFVDLKFAITKYWQDDQKNHLLRINGLMGNDTVGFEVSFRPDMQNGVVDGKVDQSRFYEEGINLYSIGEQSDNFIIGLIDLYKVDCKLRKMKDTIITTTFILGGHPENIDTENIKTKVFIDNANEFGLYSELYINIDLKNNIFELKEKDPEYRLNIIQMLAR